MFRFRGRFWKPDDGFFNFAHIHPLDVNFSGNEIDG